MTNEEKARELSDERHCIGLACWQCIIKVTLEMAKWKDELAVNAYKEELVQFKNILNRIRRNSGEIIDIEKSVEQFKRKLKGGQNEK